MRRVGAGSTRAATAVVAATLIMTSPRALRSQTEYADLESGRPLRVQGASAIERYAFEAQLGPSILAPPGGNAWALDAALLWGVLPRTQLELTVPVTSVPAAGGRTNGVAGPAFGALYALNVETRTLPAMAVAANVTTTAGPLAPLAPSLTLEGLVTRSLGASRVHLNASATIGPADSAATFGERTRWFVGAAVDHAWPLSSVLAAAEITASRPLTDATVVEWRAGAGARWQWEPHLVLDAGISRLFSGNAPAWSATVGVSWTFAIAALMAPR